MFGCSESGKRGLISDSRKLFVKESLRHRFDVVCLRLEQRYKTLKTVSAGTEIYTNAKTRTETQRHVHSFLLRFSVSPRFTTAVTSIKEVVACLFKFV